MAQEAQINIKINGGQAQKSLDDIGKKLISANAGLEKTIQRYGENSKAADKYRKTIAGLLVEQDKINKSLGNNGKQAQSLQTQYRALMKELGTLKQGTPQFEELRKKAAELKDQMGDLAQEVRGLASDTRKLDFGIGVINGLSGAFGAVTGAAALFGVENEELEKSMQKLLAVSTMMNGVNTVAQTLNKSSVVGMELRAFWTKITTAETIKNTAAQTGQNAATGAGVVTTNALNVAMRALPFVAIAAAIGVLVVGIYKYAQASNKVSKEEKHRIKLLEEHNQKMKSARESMIDEIGGFQTMALMLKETNAGSKERSLLISEINEKYGTTLKNLKDEELFQTQINEAINNYLGLQKVKFSLASNEEYLKSLFTEERVNKSLVDDVQRQLDLELEKSKVGREDTKRITFLQNQITRFNGVLLTNQNKQKALTEEQLKLFTEQRNFMDLLGIKDGDRNKSAKTLNDDTEKYNRLLDEINGKLNREIKARKELNKLATQYTTTLTQQQPLSTAPRTTPIVQQNLPPGATQLAGGGGRPQGAPQQPPGTQPPKPKTPMLTKAELEQLNKLQLDFFTSSVNTVTDALDAQSIFGLNKLSQYTKQINQINEGYLNERYELINDAIQQEIKVEEEKFKSGKIKSAEYLENVELIYSLGEANLTESEKRLLKIRREVAQLEIKALVETESDKRDILIAQARVTEMESVKLELELNKQREIQAIESSEQTEEKKQKAILKIRQDYAKVERNMITEMNKYKLELLDKEEEIELKKAESDEERINITRRFTLKRVQLEKDAFGEIVALEKATAEETKKTFEERIATIEQNFSRLSNGMMNIFNNANDMSRQQQEQNLSAVEQSTNRELELYEKMNKEKLMSDDEFVATKNQIEQRRLQEERKLKREQFNKDKKNNMANAIISGAQAVLQALASSVPPLNFILAGLVGGATAVQIGTIQQQEFTAKSGGIVPQNGLPSDVDSVKAKLAPGEAVINANSTSMFGPLLSMINQAGGGIPLVPQTGGGNMNVGGVNNEPQVVRAYVVEQDITDSQNRINRIKRSVEF